MLSRDLADMAVTHGCCVACGMAAGGIPTRWASVDVPTAPRREPRWVGTWDRAWAGVPPASPWMHGADGKTGAASRDSSCCLYRVSHDHL